MYRVIDDLNSFNPKEGKQYLYIMINYEKI